MTDKKDQISLIEDLYSRLYFLNNIKMNPIRDEIYKMCRKDEKGHRNFVGSEYKTTVAVAAKYFATQAILEGMIAWSEHETNEPVVSLASIESTRHSYLLGTSYGANYADIILERITVEEARNFLNDVSYTDIIK